MDKWRVLHQQDLICCLESCVFSAIEELKNVIYTCAIKFKDLKRDLLRWGLAFQWGTKCFYLLLEVVRIKITLFAFTHFTNQNIKYHKPFCLPPHKRKIQNWPKSSKQLSRHICFSWAQVAIWMSFTSPVTVRYKQNKVFWIWQSW